jgi:PAS domain S-box-containing protein
MDPDISQKMKEINTYLESLLDSGFQVDSDPEMKEERVTKSQILLEELQVTLEELHQTNEELGTTQTMLNQERQNYLDLFIFAPNGIVVTDVNGKILEANPAAARLLGKSLEKLSGGILVNRLAPDQRRRFRQLLLQLGNESEYKQVKMQFDAQFMRDKDHFIETVLTVVNITRALDEHENQALLWHIHDISGLKQAQAALEAANRELEQRVAERTAQLQQANEKLRVYAAQVEQKNRDLQDFAFIVSHD